MTQRSVILLVVGASTKLPCSTLSDREVRLHRVAPDDALNAAQRIQPDLVLIDAAVSDALILVDALKSDPAFDKPFVAGLGDGSAPPPELLDAADGWIPRDLDGPALTAQLHTFLDLQRLMGRLTKRKETEAALAHRMRQLALLSEVGEEMVTLLDVDAILDRAAYLLHRSLGYHYAGIFLLEEVGSLRMVTKVGAATDRFPEDYRLSFDEGMVGWVGRHGVKRLANDVAEDPHFINPFADALPTRSELALPLKVDSELIGVLDVQSPELNAFDEYDVRVLQTVADQVAVAVENARLFGALQSELGQRRRTEAALRRSEERYRLLADNTVDAIWQMNLDLVFTYVNPAVEPLLGYRPDEWIGTSVRDHVVPDALARIVAIVEENFDYLPETPQFIFEVEMFHRSGALVPVEVSGRIVTDADGRPIGCQGTTRDISERKRIDDERRRSLDELRFINEAIVSVNQLDDPDAICDRFAESVYSVNPDAYVVVTLYDPELQAIRMRAWRGFGPILDRLMDLIGRDPRRIAVPVEAMGAEAQYYVTGKLERMPDGVVSLSSGTVPRALGPAVERLLNLGSIYTMGFALQDQPYGGLVILMRRGGELQYASAIETVGSHLAQILYRRQAERAVTFERNLLRSLLDNSPDAIYFKDKMHRFVRASRSTAEYLNTQPERLVGKTDVAFFAEDLAADLEAEEDRVMASKTPIVGKVGEIGLPDGETRWVSTTKLPWLDAEGRVMGTMGISRDVTEERQMEEAMRQQERLAAVGQLAGGIAHDFNNLLASIILYAQLPLNRQSDLPAHVVRSLRTILEESNRAADLVQQILDFSRRALLETESLDLVSFTERVMAVLRRTIPENIELSLELCPVECVVEADPTRIQQALVNLAVNARDAMPDGGRLRIGVRATEISPGATPPVQGMEPGNWACITVSDTGHGMTDEVLDHLFEPFFTTKGPGQGTGLGLSQVFGIISQYGGAIDVETAPDEGTTFALYLPRVSGGAHVAAAEDTASRLVEGRAERIVLVEDAAELRVAIQDFLEALGYRVQSAPDGETAFTLLQQTCPDLLITDIVMPQIGGKELLRRTRDLYPNLPAVAITGYILETDLQSLADEGFDAVLSKPFDIEDLIQTVRRILDDA